MPDCPNTLSCIFIKSIKKAEGRTICVVYLFIFSSFFKRTAAGFSSKNIRDPQISYCNLFCKNKRKEKPPWSRMESFIAILNI